jgi:hypothetical protein
MTRKFFPFKLFFSRYLLSGNPFVQVLVYAFSLGLATVSGSSSGNTPLKPAADMLAIVVLEQKPTLFPAGLALLRETYLRVFHIPVRLSMRGDIVHRVGTHKEFRNPAKILGFWNPRILLGFEPYSCAVLRIRAKF